MALTLLGKSLALALALLGKSLALALALLCKALALALLGKSLALALAWALLGKSLALALLCKALALALLYGSLLTSLPATALKGWCFSICLLESEVEADDESSDDEVEDNDEAALSITERQLGKQNQESSAARGKANHRELKNHVESNFEASIDNIKKTDLKTVEYKVPEKQLNPKPLNHIDTSADTETSDDNKNLRIAQKRKSNAKEFHQNKRARNLKSLEIDSDCEQEEELSDGAENHRRKRRTIKQTRWSPSEREAVDEHFLNYILRNEVPRKEQLEPVLMRDKRLASRTWKNLSDHIRNRIKAQR